MMTVCPLETLAVFNIPFELTNRGLVVMHLRYTCSTPGVGSDCLHIQAVQRGNAEPIRKELCAPLKLSRGLNCTLTHRCICADIAQFNRVVGGMFILQHRRQRTNAANQYSKFYPVQYTDEPDEQPFGPLYRECVNGQTAGCTEPTFNKNQALLENSGIVGITNICDTFENVPLREEFCDTICLIDAPARLAGELVGHDTRSWDTGNQQCVTCRGMCLDHFQAEDKTTEAQASSPAGQEALTRLCSSCIDYYEAEEEDDDLGKYSSLGSLHFYADPLPAGDSANCAAYKERCSELLCNGCITMDAQPVLNSPIIFDEESNVCFKKLPICDEYLYSQRELTCTATVLAEIGGCVPTTIGDGTCDESCNTAYCGYDRGDCCTDNLASRDMPTCLATWSATGLAWEGAIGDGACNEACWNEYCLQDGGDCVFCTEQCMRPVSTPECDICRNDCRSEACQALCPGHTACTGECAVCPLERSCIPDEIVPCTAQAIDDAATWSEHLQRGRHCARVPMSHNATANRAACSAAGPDCEVAERASSLGHCLPQKLGDGVCDFECFTGACSYDAGDCGTCPPECVLRQGDGVCDEQCYYDCPGEIEDCPDCSPGCNPFEVGDGTCNPECYTVPTPPPNYPILPNCLNYPVK
jgi:hypothetical protein